MVIPEEREGRMENDPELERNTAPANATVNTRKGGAEFGISTVPQKVNSSGICLIYCLPLLLRCLSRMEHV